MIGESNLFKRFWRVCWLNSSLRVLTLAVIISLLISFTIYNCYYAQRHLIQITGFPKPQNVTVNLTERFKQRHDHVENRCVELGFDKFGYDRLYTLNPWEFIISNKYRLVYCNIFKAASTSWLYNFNLLAGDTPEFLDKSRKSPVTLIRNNYPRPSVEELQQALKTHLSFLIVRHPFERLVSAYVDKLINKINHPYIMKKATLMISETRWRWEKLLNRNDPRLSAALKDKITDLANFQSGASPTFEEFVRYIICQSKDNRLLDEHWTPMTPFCSPCFAHFDIIIKFETLHEEQNYLIKKAKLDKIIKPMWKNPTNKDHKYISREYFSQLSRQQVEDLVSIYYYDFELFQYSSDEYLEYAQQNTTTIPCNPPHINTFSNTI